MPPSAAGSLLPLRRLFLLLLVELSLPRSPRPHVRYRVHAGVARKAQEAAHAPAWLGSLAEPVLEPVEVDGHQLLVALVGHGVERADLLQSLLVGTPFPVRRHNVVDGPVGATLQHQLDADGWRHAAGPVNILLHDSREHEFAKARTLLAQLTGRHHIVLCING
uniref:Putative secreted protein n=1 Tax=Ixodes ricinus TaxID=34613 RepID=A0A6B0UY38_IXORI